MNYLKIAQKIINGNCYLSLAVSCDKKNWIAPLYYVFDGANQCFYFVSKHSTKHSRIIKKNPYVSISIFNSQDKSVNVNGIQMDALCEQVKIKDVPKALQAYYKDKSSLNSPLVKARFKNPLNPLEYIKLTDFRIYKLTPLHMYLLDTRILKDDVRVEVEF